MRTYLTLGALKDCTMRVLPGTCPSWALSLESSNPALVPPPTSLGGWHHPESGHWVLQHWPGQYQGPDQARTRFRALGTSGSWSAQSPARSVDGWASRGQSGCRAPISAPVLGDAAAPSHFPLGPLLAFQAAAFSIVNLETEKEAGGAGEAAGR